MSDRFQQLRLVEALLFASAEPLAAAQIKRHLPEDADLDDLLEELRGLYANRGVNLVRIGERWAFRTAADLAPAMQIEHRTVRKPSRAAIETLAIIAYHQPVTRAEIEDLAARFHTMMTAGEDNGAGLDPERPGGRSPLGTRPGGPGSLRPRSSGRVQSPLSLRCRSLAR